jgi:hypothetical protein
MTVNRLTDADWQGVIDDNVMPCPPTPKQLKEIAAEILTLRRENEMLRKMVEEFNYIGFTRRKDETNTYQFQYNGPNPNDLKKWRERGVE